MASFEELKKRLETKPSPPADVKPPPPVKEGREIEGYSLEECIKKAESLLQVSQSRLKYEIIEKGGKGVLGVGKKLFKVRFSVSEKEDLIEDSSQGLSKETPGKKVVSVDGTAKMVVKKEGAFLKVTAPGKKGVPTSVDDVLNILAAKNFKSYNGNEIKKITQVASGEWTKIGEYIPNSELDSRAEVQINDDEMKAYVNVSAPILSGRMFEEEEIVALLESRGVVLGIKNDKIKEILEEEHYNVPMLVAEGFPAENGQNASINFHFNIDSDSASFEEDDWGKVDYFTDQGHIQNVVAGQILALKTPPTQGKNGKTITGKEVKAQDGEEVPFQAGKNAIISESGLEIVAQAAGRAIYFENTIEVEPIYEVKGDVGLKTGSIVFLGDVIVTGGVQDGFSIKAAGNIHIGGSIGKCEVEADGDIIVQRGILGKDEGHVKAGANVFAKFIENSKVTAGGKVVAGEGILHSHVDAKQVYCLGKRGSISGGHIRTVEEVNAKTIGSTTYTETKIEAGVDPSAKEKLMHYEKERDTIEDNLSKLTVNLRTMQTQKQSLGTLSPERELMLDRMVRAKKEFDSQLNELTIDIEELKGYLGTLTSNGKVSAADKVYPGTEVTIKNATLKVKSEYPYVTFIFEGGEVCSTPYQEPKGMKSKKSGSTKSKKGLRNVKED